MSPSMALTRMLKTTVLLSLLNYSLAASNTGFTSFSNSTSTSTLSSSSTELSSTTIPTSDSSSSSSDPSSTLSSSDSSSTSSQLSTTSSSSSSAAPGVTSTTVPPPTSSQESTTTSTDVTFPTPPPDVVITGDLGPITLGPQTSTESGDFTSMQTGIPGLTTDSATQTSTDGHNTILPIWFLAGGIGIIKLPAPGINPGGIIPPPPGFPPLFIGSNGSPTTGGPPQGTKDPQTSSTDNPTSSNPTSSNPTSSNPSSTSDSCTTATASSCVQTCTPISDAQGSQTVTCGQASCAPSTGCSATATTSTTTVAEPSCTSGCSECSKYQGDGEDVPADNGGSDEPDAAKRRSQLPPSIAGRISLSLPLEKRADDFDTFNQGTPDACTLAKNLKIPNYPKPNGLPGKAAGGAQFWWVMTETTAPNTCPVLDYNKVSDAAVTSQKINPADATAYTKGGDWSRTNPTVNVDHVYELSILKQFFSGRVNAANCADFKKFFDVADGGSPQVAGDTRLQTIWRQLPSNTNPDFAGMDAKINAIKAQAFSKGFSNPTGPDNSLGYLYQMALAFKLTNDPLVSPLFQKTNNRIYAALLGMDSLINTANCGSTTTPVIQGDWASSYETFITDLLTTAGTDVNTKISAILNDDTKLGPAARVGPGSTTGADGTATATTNSIGRGVDAFLLAYPTPNAFTFNVNNLVVFPQTSTLPIKRQACSRPPTTESQSSTSQSASQTTAAPSTETSVSATSTPPITSESTSVTSVPPSSSTEEPPATSTTPTEPCSEPDGCTCSRGDDGKCNCLCT